MVEEGGNATKVRVDGEEAVLHITDQSVMFEKGGRLSGFERSAIRMVEPDGDAMIIAYASGNDVKSVRVEPMTAVALLLVSDTAQAQPSSQRGLDTILERLYRETRKELEAKLAKVEEEPTNMNLRLSQQEMERYIGIRNQMLNLVGAKYGVNPNGDEPLLTFWGLESQSLERQLDVVKTMHIHFLVYFVSQRAETEDVGYQAYQVWPDDWPRILTRFNLEAAAYTGDKFNNYVSYLKSHWKYSPGDKRPVLASA